MPKISVIVPVYNTEKYLRRCIDSILAQTFTDFELLLVDDGSKDNSGAICDEYAKKDPRVRVFHKENGGVSSARNLGLDEAKGEWIAFVDSDDYILRYYLYNFYNAREKGSFLICGNEEKEYDAKTYTKGLLTNIFFWGLPCKLYHCSLFREKPLNISPKIFMGEDLIVNLYLSTHIDHVSYVKNDGYIYYNNVESVTHTRKYSLEQQELFLYEVGKAISNDDIYDDAFWLFKIRNWKSLMLNNILIGKEVPFVQDILNKKELYDIPMGIGDNVLLRVHNRYIAWILLKFIYMFKK